MAFVAPELAVASGWRSLSVGIVSALERRGAVEPVLVTSRRDASAAAALFPRHERRVVAGTQFMRLDDPGSWPRLLATRWAVATGDWPRVDLVHSLEAYPTGLVGHWLAGGFGVPHVLTTAGTYGVAWHRARWDRRLYEAVLRRAARVCPISGGTASLLRVHFGSAVPTERVQVVLPGSDYHRTVPRGVALTRTPAAPPALLTVGAVKPRKGHDLALRAFRRVQERYAHARYWIVGALEQTAYHRSLLEIVAAEGLRNVEFLGTVSDERLDRCYRDASVFVLTPRAVDLHFEGFGLVFLEAGAHALPVVATRTGGVADAVRDGETGLLAEPDDVDGVAQAILRLLDDPAVAGRMGRAGRDWAETLTWDRYAAEQRGVYDSCLEAPTQEASA